MSHPLDRWHEIHDAYVDFFGDEHRPAAVRCADDPPTGVEEIVFAPGAVWQVEGPLIQIFQPAYSLKRELTQRALYGSALAESLD